MISFGDKKIYVIITEIDLSTKTFVGGKSKKCIEVKTIVQLYLPPTDFR